MRQVLVVAILATSAFADSSSTAIPVEKTANKPIVLVSIAPQKFFVDRIAGDLVKTEVLIPATVSVETYEPTIAQLSAAERAALYLIVGHPRFPFEQAWLERLRRPGMKVVDCSQGMSLIPDDPHLWVSPFNAGQIIDCFEQQLKLLLADAASGEVLVSRANLLRSQLNDLIAESDRQLLPLRERSFIIYHPELGYLADHYKLHQLSLENEGKEVGTKSLIDVISQGRKLGIKTILVQPQFVAREAELVADELKARVVRIDPLAYNWLDNTQAMIKKLADALRYDETSNKN